MRACVNLVKVDIAVAELQSVLRGSVYITPPIDDQLRYMSSFNVLVYVPRDATFAASDMTALPIMDHFAFLRDSLLTVLRLGLNDEAPKIRSPSTVFLTSRPRSTRSPTSSTGFSSRTTVLSVVACSCSLVSSTVTSAYGKATCLHLCVTNIQEPCLPE